MNEQIANDLLNQLANGEIEKFQVKKEDFLEFRLHLVKREDFKHFRGVAERGGNVTYYYMDEPRS